MTHLRASPSSDTLRPLHGEVLLGAWETGSQQPRPLRAATLLAAGSALDEAEAAALAVPERDAALLALRRHSFGSSLQAFATCDNCAEHLEFTLTADAIAQQLDEARRVAGSLRYGAWSLHCRFATTEDIAAAAAEPTLPTARQLLLTRCVTAVDESGRTVPLADMTPELLAAADERLVAMHEAAELSISLECPACQSMQHLVVDLAEYIWIETRHAAQRLLAEVHELAWAYGWAESAILGMAAPRRAAYLSLVRA